jgi:sugar diacid utilization regulator
MKPTATGPVPRDAPVPADVSRRLAAVERLADVLGAGGGITGLTEAAADLLGRQVWVLDPAGRTVAVARRSATLLPAPDLESLLQARGPVDAGSCEVLLVSPEPEQGSAWSHLLAPVRRAGSSFAWLVAADGRRRFTAFDAYVVARAAEHIATEYTFQRRISRASSNALSALARQLVRGSSPEDELRLAADYLGVRAAAARIVVYVADPPDQADPTAHPLAEDIADSVSHQLDVEVLVTRGSQGSVLLVEAPPEIPSMALVARVKTAVSGALREASAPVTAVGVSSVTQPQALPRAYREAREVALCVQRFGAVDARVMAVDDLGPARLFVANSSVDSVRRYVDDVLGPLLTTPGGDALLLRTLQCFFDAGRGVRQSAARLGIHENTLRLRLAKVKQATGLDVAADPTAQLSVQTALLVLRLTGHPTIASFAVAGEDPPRTMTAS